MPLAGRRLMSNLGNPAIENIRQFVDYFFKSISSVASASTVEVKGVEFDKRKLLGMFLTFLKVCPGSLPLVSATIGGSTMILYLPGATRSEYLPSGLNT